MPGAADTKKILCDEKVSALARAGVSLCMSGALSDRQLEAWIKLDEEYIERAEKILALPSSGTRDV